VIKVGPEINTWKPTTLWVGRDPGLYEINDGRPFVGKAGQKLDEGMSLAGLRRKDHNFANRVGYKPWNNKFENHKDEHIEEGKIELFRLIRKLKPELVVSLGNEASFDLVPEFKEITGSTSIRDCSGITKIRGYFFWNEELQTWVLASFHPSSVLYQATQQFQLFADIKRAADFVRGDLPRLEMPLPLVLRSPAAFAALKDSELTAFDIETKWAGDELLVTAFCGNDLQPYYTWASDLSAMQEFLGSHAHRKVAHNGKFDEYFLTYHCGTAVGNLSEDTMVLHWAMYPELAGQEDTGAEEKYEPRKRKGRMTRKGLNFLASLYLNVPWWKDYEHDDPGRMARLCCQDVWVTRMLHDIMYPKAEAMGVIEQYRENMALQSSLITTQHRGILIDEELRKDRIKKLRDRMKKAKTKTAEAALDYIVGKRLDFFRVTKQCKCCNGVGERCWRCAGLIESPKRKAQYVGMAFDGEPMEEWRVNEHTVAELKEMLPTCTACDAEGKTSWYEFNPMSSQQMEELLYGELEAPRSLMVGDSPCNQATLRKILEEWASKDTRLDALSQRRQIAHSILAPYFGAKKDRDQMNIYKRIKPAKDGSIRTELSSAKVTTSRFSSSGTFVIASTNLQNISKVTAFEDPLYQVRQCFVPGVGYVFLLADYEKAEAIIAAAQSEDWPFYDKLIAGEDIHSWHAEQYFGEATEITRQISKEVTYASAYLATTHTVQERINRNYWKTGIKLSLSEVERVHRLHLNLHPLEEWWDRVARDLREDGGWLTNPLGLRRKFENPVWHDRWKQAVNWECQGTVASCINRAWRRVWNEVDYENLHELRHQVHDEIMMVVREDLLEDTGVKVKDIMEEPLTVRGREIYIPVEVCVGRENWQDKEVLRFD
jgi:uracil-DNA glycosylase family 4